MSKKSRELTDSSAESVSGGTIVDMGNNKYNVLNEFTGETVAEKVSYKTALDKVRESGLSDDTVTFEKASIRGYDPSIKLGDRERIRGSYNNNKRRGDFYPSPYSGPYGY